MSEVAVLLEPDRHAELYVIPERDFDIDSFLQTLEDLGVKIVRKEISFCG